MQPHSRQRRVLSVTALTRQIRDALEGFSQVLVSGEISDLSRPQSGHLYFSLKDQRSQIRAVAWRTTAQQLNFEPRDGQEVVCRGNLDVYGPRGSYQLVVRSMEPVGVGDWQRKLQALQRKLAAAGYFDARSKQPLPAFARHIVVVTSPSGAAVRDFLEVARRRWPAARVTIAPVRVQGLGAAQEISGMIRRIQHMRPTREASAPDVIVVTRGGGSVEDLWCFNEEPIVKAVFESRIPVVSAVGHEVDVTLCDLAADVRALTPSEAAELVLPSAAEVGHRLKQLGQRLGSGLRSRAERSRSQLLRLLQHRAMRRPLDVLLERARRLDELQQRGQRAIQRRLERSQETLAGAAGRLESLSPLAVLSRGYAVALDDRGQLVPEAAGLRPGQSLRLRFRDGSVAARVEQSEAASDDERDPPHNARTPDDAR